MSFDPNLAVDRVPAELSVPSAQRGERTAHLKLSHTMEAILGDAHQTMLESSAEVDLLESLGPDPWGTAIDIRFAAPKLAMKDVSRQIEAVRPEVPDLVRRFEPRFIVDETNSLCAWNNIRVDGGGPQPAQQQAFELLHSICNAYDALPVHDAEPQARTARRLRRPTCRCP